MAHPISRPLHLICSHRIGRRSHQQAERHQYNFSDISASKSSKNLHNLARERGRGSQRQISPSPTLPFFLFSAPLLQISEILFRLVISANIRIIDYQFFHLRRINNILFSINDFPSGLDDHGIW